MKRPTKLMNIEGFNDSDLFVVAQEPHYDERVAILASANQAALYQCRDAARIRG
jgi:hypothetical protein